MLPPQLRRFEPFQQPPIDECEAISGASGLADWTAHTIAQARPIPPIAIADMAGTFLLLGAGFPLLDARADGTDQCGKLLLQPLALRSVFAHAVGAVDV